MLTVVPIIVIFQDRIQKLRLEVEAVKVAPKSRNFGKVATRANCTHRTALLLRRNLVARARAIGIFTAVKLNSSRHMWLVIHFELIGVFSFSKKCSDFNYLIMATMNTLIRNLCKFASKLAGFRTLSVGILRSSDWITLNNVANDIAKIWL